MNSGITKVLLVTDNLTDYQNIQAMLDGGSEHQFELQLISDYQLAVTASCQSDRDAILVDWEFQNYQGLELLEEIVRTGCKAPLIFLTAPSNELLDKTALKHGATECLVKTKLDAQFLQRGIHYTIDRKCNEEQIQFQANVLAHVSDAVVVTDCQHHITYWNRGAEKLYGYTKEEAIGKNIESIIRYCWLQPTDKISAINTLLTTGAWQGELIHIHKDGSEIYVESSASLLNANADQFQGFLSVTRNITERKRSEQILQKLNEDLEKIVKKRTDALLQANQELLIEVQERQKAEAALRGSEEKFRHIFEDAPIGIGLINFRVYRARAHVSGFGIPSVDITTSKFMQVNDALCQLLGYTEDELKNLEFAHIVPAEDLAKEADYFNQAMASSVKRYQLEKRYITKSNETIWTNFTVAIVCDDCDNPLYGLGMIEDISDRKRANEALRQSEERFRKIFEDSPLGMAVIGFNQRILKVNNMLCQMLGYTEAELMSLPFDSLIHPNDTSTNAVLSKLLYYGKLPHYQVEKRYLKKNQEPIWILFTASAVRDQKGKTLYSLAMLRDITKQKHVQDLITSSLQEKELLLREIHHRVKNNLHIISNLLDLQSQYLDNPELLDMFADSQNRIQTMALIHEQLYQSTHLGRIDFAEYLKTLVHNLFVSYNINSTTIRQALDVEPFNLNLETAIPCGLLVNELVANSLKYAFPNNESGTVCVKFRSFDRRERDTQDKVLVLTISDNGVGIPKTVDWQNTNSLGLRLVRILVRQLEGTIEVDCSGGTEFRITFNELKYKERLHSV